MKIESKGLAILLLLFTASYAGPQLQQPRMSLGGVGLELDMPKQEALKKLSLCCKPISLGDAAVIVTDKADINRGFGMVYFADSKVSGIAADTEWSPEPSSYETALAFYRLVDERTHGSPSANDGLRTQSRHVQRDKQVCSHTIPRWEAH
jgi:hypothetical protein